MANHTAVRELILFADNDYASYKGREPYLANMKPLRWK